LDGCDVPAFGGVGRNGRRQSSAVEAIHNAFPYLDGLGCIILFERNGSLGRVNCRSGDGGSNVINAAVAMFGFTSIAIG